MISDREFSSFVIGKRVAARVQEIFPKIDIKITGPTDSLHATTVIFTPRREDEVVITLYVDEGDTFDLAAGQFVVFEMGVVDGDADAWVNLLVRNVLEVAKGGVVSRGLSRVLFRWRPHCKPWA